MAFAGFLAARLRDALAQTKGVARHLRPMRDLERAQAGDQPA